MLQAWMKRLFSDPSGAEAKEIRYLQWLRISLLVGVLGLFIFAVIAMRGGGAAQENDAPAPKKKVTLAADSVADNEVWANRVQDIVEAQKKEIEAMRLEGKVMKERINAVEKINMDALKNANGEQIEGRRGEPSTLEIIPGNDNYSKPTTGAYNEPLGFGQREPSRFSNNSVPRVAAKMGFVSVETQNPLQFNADRYVVAGTYSQAVLLSGLVVSTSVASQSNPQPIALRLIDSGNMPRGWHSHVKDAVLIGSCYGDLSAERAMCRINTLSFMEEDGTGVEIAVEGWMFGEDGAPGLRGKVVDRAGEVARESLIAGILGGMSNFLKNDAVSSVFPVTPFGQTNALSTKEVLKGSFGSGASNALDKLAEFSIKRAESMQPVIIVNGGRRVDVLFKKGFSLKRSVTATMRVKVDE